VEKLTDAEPDEDPAVTVFSAAGADVSIAAAGAVVGAPVGCNDAGVAVAGLAQADNIPASKSRTTNLTCMDFIFDLSPRNRIE
jgi:hypothetical protein